MAMWTPALVTHCHALCSRGTVCLGDSFQAQLLPSLSALPNWLLPAKPMLHRQIQNRMAGVGWANSQVQGLLSWVVGGQSLGDWLVPGLHQELSFIMATVFVREKMNPELPQQAEREALLCPSVVVQCGQKKCHSVTRGKAVAK